MAKNRKHQSVAIRFGPAVKALLLCSLFVVSGVGYVWQKSLIADLDRHMKASEQALDKLKEQNKKLRETLAEGTSFRALNKRLVELKLGLTLPPEAQVLRLAEPAEPPAAPPPLSVQQFAARP